MGIETYQTWFNALMVIVGGMSGWWMQVMWTELKNLQQADRTLVDRVAAIDLLVAGQYVKRDYFESRVADLSQALFSKLDRIEDKIDRKVDKGHA